MEHSRLTAEEPQDLLVWIDLCAYGTAEPTPCLFCYDTDQPDRFEMTFSAATGDGTEPATLSLERAMLQACLNGDTPDPEERPAIQAWLSDDGQFVTFLFFRGVHGIAYAPAASLRDLLDQSYAVMSEEAEGAFISAMLAREFGLYG